MDDRNHEPTDAKATALQPHATAAANNGQGRLDRRRRRLEDLTDQALEELDPLRANLKAAAAQLFDIGFRLGDELKTNIGSEQAKSKARREAAGGVNTVMLVHRQITRYVQLDQQWDTRKSSTHNNGEPLVEADSGS